MSSFRRFLGCPLFGGSFINCDRCILDRCILVVIEAIDRSTSSASGSSGGSGRLSTSTLSGHGSVEPVAGGLRSKGSSDMEVCSEGSAEAADEGEVQRLKGQTCAWGQ